jgi:hypothetical protein
MLIFLIFLFPMPAVRIFVQTSESIYHAAALLVIATILFSCDVQVIMLH